MKRILLLILLCISTSLVAQTTAIPDPIFETFLEANGMGNGIAGDNLVTTANIQNVGTLNVNGLNITSLIGIEDFTGLTVLRCADNNLETLDLSSNTNLVSLFADGNGLTSINLNGVTGLDFVTLHDNALPSLDISNNPGLGSLTAWNNGLTSIDLTNCAGLTELYLQDNMLTDLDLSLFPNLSSIDFTNNALTTLNLKNGGNGLLGFNSSIKATGNPNLECITVDDAAYSYATWGNIDTTTSFSEDCAATTNIPNAIFEDYLETHDADGNIVVIGDPTGMGNGIANDNLVKTPRIERVTTLDVSSLNIDDLTGIEGFAALETLSCYLNQLTALDVTSNVNLEILQVSNNSIIQLDLKNNIALQTLNVDNNSLSILNLSNNTLLTSISAAENDLKVLDMNNGNNANVTTFFATGNSNLKCIKVDNDTASYLSTWIKDPATSFGEDCNETNVPDANFENYLETHDPSGTIVPIGDITSMGNGVADDAIVYTANIENVIALSMGFKGIENLTGIEDFMALETLSCPFNNIETVDLSSNLALTSLTATSSNIKFLNVSNNTNLTSLTVSNNDIEFLDLSNNSNLTNIAVSNNELVFLNNQNGNNGNVTSFIATGNSSLDCINVDDETASYLNNTSIWIKDGAANYGIHCDETYITNANFENYLETHNALGVIVPLNDPTSMGNGIAADHYVTTANINTVTSLDVNNLGIDNLTGIEDFVALTELYAYDNSFEYIDVSTLSQLVTLFIHRGSLKALDVTSNTLLEDLRADTNALDQIDLTNNPLLQILQLTINDIEYIDVTANIALTRFRINGNPIKELDLSTNIALTEFTGNSCDLTYLNVKNGNNGIIANFNANNNPNLACINVDNATDAEAGNGNYNTWTKDGTASYGEYCDEVNVPDDNFEYYLETHNASGTIVPINDPTSMGNGIDNDNIVFTTAINKVTSLDVSSLNITDLTGIEGFTALETLNCYSNNLDALDISANTALEALYCYSSNLDALDISVNTALKTVICYSNNLDELVLSTNVNLETLVAHTNVITSLNADTCVVLEEFIVSNNNLDTLSVANGNNGNMSFTAVGNPSLSCINVDNDTASYLSNWGKDTTATFNAHCYETYIPDANFETFLEANGMGNNTPNDNYVLTSNISGVLILDVNNLSIESLTGIEAFTALETLFCYRNNLDELDLSANTALTFLECYNNQLDELDLSTNTNLEVLDANTNTIAAIDVQFNTALKTINLDGNDLTVLNLDTCVALENLSVDNNNLNELNIINGNNAAIIEFDASSNPNLICINVDDPSQSYLDAWVKDVTATFGEHCYDTYVPDNNFENYLETHDAAGNVVPVGDPTSMGNGTDNDNYVYTVAINTVTSLTLSNLAITNLTGLEGFIALEYLNCDSNTITVLDVSNNLNLNTLEASLNTTLTTLITTGLTGLHTLKITNSSLLTDIDIASNTALVSLNVRKNGLTALDVTQNINLETLNFANNVIETIDVTLNTSLTALDATNNDLGTLSLGTVDVTQNTSLDVLDLLNCGLTTLDVTQNINLTTLDAGSNDLQTIDLSQNTGLVSLIVSYNQLTELSLIQNSLLEMLDVSNNELVELDIRNGANALMDSSGDMVATGNPNLSCINVDDVSFSASHLGNWIIDSASAFGEHCHETYIPDANFEDYLETHDALGNVVALGNENSMGNGVDNDNYVYTAAIDPVTSLDLSSLDISVLTGIEAFVALDYLNCNFNTIEVLDVSNNTNLNELYVSLNATLTSVITTDLTALHTLSIINNSLLTSVDVTTNTGLVSLYLKNNGLTALDVTQNTGLEVLEFQNNAIETIDVTQNISLVTLEVANNDLGTLNLGTIDVTQNTSLEVLDLSNTGLETLDVTQNINLTTLLASNNGLETVDLNQNIDIETLSLSNNQLTELVLIQNSLLKLLDVSNNELVLLDIRNGANGLMSNYGDMVAIGNPNLSCINVDDASASATYLDNWVKDASASFGENCYETYVPDANFENYLETHDADGNVVALGDPLSMGNGTPNDDTVYTSRISNVTELNVSNLSIEYLTGIENFTALESLLCYSNNLDTLDVSSNTALINLVCYFNQLTILDVTSNVNLEVIEAGNNALTTLDLHLNTALKRISVYDNDLTSLSVDVCVSLELLDLENNDLTELRVVNGNNIGITGFDTRGNPNLTCISVDDPTQSYLDDWITNIDGSTSFGEHCNETYILDAIFENYLETHDADRNSVDIGDPTSMGNGIANDNYVSTKRIEVVTDLRVYNLDILDLTGIEDFTALEELNCGRNGLTTLDVTQNVLLTELSFDYNQLTSINLTNNTTLTSLSFIDNDVVSIDLSQNVLLDYFAANENQFTSLDFSNNPLMVEIDCSENLLTNLNLSQCTVLEELYCNYNLLQTIDLTGNTALLYFEAEYNSLTSLDVSQNINLERFSVENNQLTSLDLSLNINIEEIMCGDNSLTSLNVKNGYNTNIALFWINNNPNLTCVLVDDAMYSFGFTIKDFQSQYNEVTCGVQVSPKVFLQGAALNPNTGEEDLMRDDLRVAGMIPTATPYTDGVTCKASVLNVTGDDAIVDWVWVELRDATDNTLVIDSQSALLQRDGDIVNVDGVTAVGFNEVSADDYYIVIKHRNHLGIMTEDTIDLFKTETILDFTDANDQITFGTDAQTTFGMESGVVALWAGDGNGDGRLNYLGASSDIPSIRSQVFNDPDNSIFGGPAVGTYGSIGYYITDSNMDGLTYYSGAASDVLYIRNNIFNNPSNSVFGGPAVATFVFMAQLP